MQVYRRALSRFTGDRSYTQSMTAHPTRRILRIASACLALTTLPLVVSACASPNPVPAGTSSASQGPEPSASPEPTTNPDGITAVALSKSCDEILTPEQLYDIKGGANFAANPDFSPASGTTGSEILGMNGVSCGFINQTSGETFSVSVAQVTPESAAPLKERIANSFGSSALVAAYSPTPAIQGYFKVNNGIGEAQVGTSAYWISIASDTFEGPTDALELVRDVETSLGK